MGATTLYAKWVDNVPPVITCLPATQSWTNHDITVTASVNEGTLNLTSQTFTGNGFVDFVASDAAGNISVKRYWVWSIDKTKPFIDIYSASWWHAPNYAVTSTSNITALITDSQSLAWKAVWRNGTRLAWPANNKFYSRGTYVFMAGDSAGNVKWFQVTLR